MIKEKLLTIVTPNLNGGKYLEQSIKSVLSQKSKLIEYIIVDGLSNDNSKFILKKYEKKIDKIIFKKDNSMYEAINTGFKFSKGKYSPDYKENPQDNLKKKSINKSSNLYFSLTDTILDSLKYPVGKVFGQDIFRSNNLSFYNKAYDAQPGENYLLGAGDELTISIWGMANHSETVVVNEKGYISTQIAGRIYVGNKSFTVSKSLINNRMSNFYDLSRSQLDVSLNYSRVINVNIIGEVFNPGS